MRDRSASASLGAAIVRDRSASALPEAAMVRDRSASPSPEAAVVRDRSASPSLRAAIVRDRSASAPRLAPRSRAVASPPARGMDELRTRAPSHVVTPKPGHRACNPGRVPSLAQQSIAADGHRILPAFACKIRRPRLNANVRPLQFEMSSFAIGSEGSEPPDVGVSRARGGGRAGKLAASTPPPAPPSSRARTASSETPPRFSWTASPAWASTLAGPPRPRRLRASAGPPRRTRPPL